MQVPTIFSWKASTPKLDWKRGFARSSAPLPFAYAKGPSPAGTLIVIVPSGAIMQLFAKQAQASGGGSKAA